MRPIRQKVRAYKIIYDLKKERDRLRYPARIRYVYLRKGIPSWASFERICTNCGKNIIVQRKVFFDHDCNCQGIFQTTAKLLTLLKKHNQTVLGHITNHTDDAYVKVRCNKCKRTLERPVAALKYHPKCNVCTQNRNKRLGLGAYSVESLLRRRTSYEATCLKKYGYRHHRQDPKMMEIAFRNKVKRVRINGKKFKVEGYEPQAIRWLIKRGVDVRDIEAGRGQKVPRISYVFEGKGCVYTPDIFIASQNLIVEVKSEYSYTHSIKRNLTKARATKKEGYKYMFLILDRKGERMDRHAL